MVTAPATRTAPARAAAASVTLRLAAVSPNRAAVTFWLAATTRCWPAVRVGFADTATGEAFPFGLTDGVPLLVLGNGVELSATLAVLPPAQPLTPVVVSRATMTPVRMMLRFMASGSLPQLGRDREPTSVATHGRRLRLLEVETLDQVHRLVPSVPRQHVPAQRRCGRAFLLR